MTVWEQGMSDGRLLSARLRIQISEDETSAYFILIGMRIKRAKRTSETMKRNATTVNTTKSVESRRLFLEGMAKEKQPLPAGNRAIVPTLNFAMQ